jgi:recombination protein RecR
MFLSDELCALIQCLSKLPGIGPRSARRMALYLMKNPGSSLKSLVHALDVVGRTHGPCSVCGYLDSRNPCFFCSSPQRSDHTLCIVAETGDVWAFEKAAFFKGRYHVLGGVLSPLAGKRPEDLNLESLSARLTPAVQEIILAMDGTLEGQTTLNYITEKLQEWAPDIHLSSLARGLPVGGTLDYMDHGTLQSAFSGRHAIVPMKNQFQQWLAPQRSS